MDDTVTTDAVNYRKYDWFH